MRCGCVLTAMVAQTLTWRTRARGPVFECRRRDPQHVDLSTLMCPCTQATAGPGFFDWQA